MAKPFGSTANMLVDFTMGIAGAPKDTPRDHPEIVGAIKQNNTIRMMRDSIDRLGPERINLYNAETEVSKLTPSLEENTLIKPDTKSQLKVRINNLIELIKQGVAIDATLTALDAKAVELKAQVLASLKTRFSKNPVDEAQAKTERDALNETIKKSAEEADRSTRSFNAISKHMQDAYTTTRRALPGQGPLTLKPINTLTTPKAEEVQPARLEK